MPQGSSLKGPPLDNRDDDVRESSNNFKLENPQDEDTISLLYSPSLSKQNVQYREQFLQLKATKWKYKDLLIDRSSLPSKLVSFPYQ